MKGMERSKTLIIAEAGVNHNGSLPLAMEMVEKAAAFGADYIKFQTFRTDSLVTSDCKAAGYQTRNCSEESQMEMLRKLELSREDFLKIHEYCRRCGIGFLSTPFDFESISFIASLHPDFMKVPSGEITNLPYLRRMAATGIPMIISTGMSTAKEVEEALIPFREAGYGYDSMILLHCTTQYPTPPEDVNLLAMKSLSEEFGLRTGYSDHTAGIEIPIAAAALGAVVIEKHFTLSREMEGPDHKASLEPEEFAGMVNSIRKVEMALGNGEKLVTDSERGNLAAARRSIVAKRKIRKGEIIREDDLEAKRPGNGLSPMCWDKVVGSVALRDYEPDDRIEL